MKKFVSVILAVMLVLYPVSVSAVPQDYDSLLEEYKELKNKYKKLKKKYTTLKEQVEGGAPAAEAEAPAAPVSDEADFDYSVLDTLALEELQTLRDKTEKKIAQVRYDTGVYPYEEYGEYKDEKVYQIGEKWDMPGFCSLTVNSVTETLERNDKGEENPAAVYLVEYTYENYGCEEFDVNLYYQADIIDSAGEAGYAYDVPSQTDARYIAAGAWYTAVEGVGVNHPGNFQIRFNLHNQEIKDTHYATFEINLQ